MIKRKSEMSEEEVLFEFSQEPTKDVRILEKYINQYPEYREALVTLSVDLFVNPVDSFTLDQASESSKGAEKAWSQLQSLLSPSDPAFIKTPSEDNPLTRLDQRKFSEMAKSLDVSRAFLSRFNTSGGVIFMILHIIEEVLDAIIILAITALLFWAIVYPDHLEHTSIMVYNVIGSLYTWITSF